MSALPCSTCARPVPDGWPACPHCGRPIRPTVRRRRPVWVYLVAGLYLLLVAAVFNAPILVVALGGQQEQFLTAAVASGIVFLLGASLLLIPIRTGFERPVRRRSVAFPLVVSALCAALLFAGSGLATLEFAEGNVQVNGDAMFHAVVGGTGLVWLGWMVLFGWLARSVAPQTINDRLYQILLAGSVLEMLVALPMHLIVRRRDQCCAGLGTGFGIGVGLVVMLIALGPAVFFLFYRRYRQVYAKPRAGQSGL